MRLLRHLGSMLLVFAWAAMPCAAQTTPASNSAPCSVAPQPEPCGTTPAPGNKPAAARKFPFPGENGGIIPTPAPASSTPNLNGVPQVPDAPVTPQTSTPAAKKDFPFPGEAAKPDAAGSPDASGSSSSSSSAGDAPVFDPDTNPATPALTDKGSQGSPPTPGRHILHRVNPVGTKLQTADEREIEDLDIAHFYLQSGDLQGAYLRSQDAVKTAPDDPDAHFALAGVALKLNKRDEAIAEYNACLKLDPPDKQARDARKALARLKP